jgi:hypothetical protein
MRCSFETHRLIYNSSTMMAKRDAYFPANFLSFGTLAAHYKTNAATTLKTTYTHMIPKLRHLAP